MDREALAIKFTLDRHKYILLGQYLTVRTDHMPLKYLFKQSNIGVRQARWLNQISEYDVREVQHVKGNKNVVADALSRAVGTVSVVTRSQNYEVEVKASASDPTCLSVRGRKKHARERGRSEATTSSRGHNQKGEVTTSANDCAREVTTSTHVAEATTSGCEYNQNGEVTTSANDCTWEVMTSVHAKDDN